MTKKNPITYSAAILRSQLISNVKYHLTLNLCIGETYQGFVRVDFELKKIDDSIFLDYYG